jgi:O-antigen/teichoic acid export membrane protein
VYLLPILAIESWRAPLRSLLHATSGLQLRRPLGALTRFAIPALVSGTAYAAIQGLDVYFVRTLAPEGLADYAGARALAMPMSLVPFAIGVVLLPRVAAADPAARAGLLARALTTVLALDALAVLGYVVLGPLVTSIVYPASFSGIPEVLPWLAAAMGVTGTYSILSQWWMGTGRPGPAAIALTIGAIVAVGAHLVLDPIHGPVGAAWAMALGAAIALAVLGAATIVAIRRGSGEAPGPVAS